MILIDTSAWIEYLRDTGSSVCERVDELAVNKAEVMTTEVVMMEVLSGAKTDARYAQLRRLLQSFKLLPVEGLADFEAAADVYRRCRKGGETVRVLADCIIAAVAIRAGVSVLHRDRDFDVIARHNPLQIAT